MMLGASVRTLKLRLGQHPGCESLDMADAGAHVVDMHAVCALPSESMGCADRGPDLGSQVLVAAQAVGQRSACDLVRPILPTAQVSQSRLSRSAISMAVRPRTSMSHTVLCSRMCHPAGLARLLPIGERRLSDRAR